MTEHTTTQAVAANAADVGHEAKAQAATVAHEAGDQVQRAWHDLRRDLRSQASQQTERAGSGLRQLDDQLQALRRGDVDAAGPVVGYAEQLQTRVHDLAERIESQGFDGVVADVRRFAQRRPGVFLASAAAAGFLAGRLARGAAAAGSGASPTTNGGTAIRPPAPPAPPLTNPLLEPTGTVTGVPPVPPVGATPPVVPPPVPPARPMGTATGAPVDPLLGPEAVVTPTSFDEPSAPGGIRS